MTAFKVVNAKALAEVQKSGSRLLETGREERREGRREERGEKRGERLIPEHQACKEDKKTLSAANSK